MRTSNLLATECKKSSNRASSSGITFRQQKVLQILGVEDAKELLPKTHGQMDQAGYLTEKIGQNKQLSKHLKNQIMRGRLRKRFSRL